ncbi:glycosyltransferase [bacterium]|nr:glycosyltransferase [bacterium]
MNRNNKPLRILVETGDGRSASVLLESGFLSYCHDRGAEVHVLSPGACYKPFVDSYLIPGTRFSYLSVEKALKVRYPRLTHYEERFGRLLGKKGFKKLQKWLWRNCGARYTARDAVFMQEIVDKEKPDCFLTAHVNQGFGRGLTALCATRGIPTIGNIFSWDHPYYEQRARPDRLTCWSKIVRDDLIRIKHFHPEQITVIGAPVFDLYFEKSGIWTREEFCDRMKLDPARPIVLFATLGQMKMFWDETGTFRAFLAALDRSNLPGPPQIILRLHPISVDHYFEEFRSREDIVFSRYKRYCPGIRWWPSREEIFLAGNMLRHADVCISPGSTMTIEAAIFDTPSLVPIFNPTMPEEYNNYFDLNWSKKHFKFLLDENTVGLARTPEQLIESINRVLNNPAWLKEGRERIRNELLGPLDGKATERLAEIVVSTARLKRTGLYEH